jgi:hypothetical protein
MASASADNPGESGEVRPRRSEDRYRLSAAVKFKWQTANGEWRQGSGVTRDVSGSGMFVLAYPVPVPDALIFLLVDVRSAPGSGPTVRFRGRGRVVRIEPSHGFPVGFGASVVFENVQGEYDQSRPADAKDFDDAQSWFEQVSRKEGLPSATANANEGRLDIPLEISAEAAAPDLAE